MRNKFDNQLILLNNLLIEMGALIEKAIALAIDALERQDVILAKQAIDFDEEINQKEKDIETLCLKLLLQQQPIAKDLRLISAALKMVTDMERIGDQAADISEITLYLAGKPYIKKLEHIPQMADATVKMVTESIDAFVKKDLNLAKAVIEYDDVVDDLFVTVRRDLIELVSSNSEHGEQVMDLLMVAKYFERIGDHAVNIAGWVVFSITGKHDK
ncbi:MAG: phosphate signaling complex protein PhoU [Lachnospiraceae bacterium]|nr:phosphate signaling complex protein PhoU [Lachnospiraceae bacterium]